MTCQSLEKDGYRAQLALHSDGQVLLRSRQGTDMTSAFPEIREAALAHLPADTGLDGELVVWESGRPAGVREASAALRPAWARGSGGGAPVAGALRGLRSAARGRGCPRLAAWAHECGA
ncbi:hypothetical protein [Streptomyces sp. NPDC051132]|uniref:ATP-dependent DNA ligase n=1 Tax=unclassified Streptomyces TaxID=2593676 RepID=UPI00341B54A7